MSGQHAMGMRLCDVLAGWCDVSLRDVCLAFVDTFVRTAGGVVCGAKPAAIFSIPMRAYCVGKWRQLTERAMDEALRAYAHALPEYGVRLTVLHRNEKRVHLLAWRPDLLDRVLGGSEAAAILKEHGYEGSDSSELMSELRRRLVAYYRSRQSGQASFPHEIGVFLGYPPEDVRGYLEGRKVTCRGAWCAYGDEQVARRRFWALEAQECRCRNRFAQGESFAALFA